VNDKNPYFHKFNELGYLDCPKIEDCMRREGLHSEASIKRIVREQREEKIKRLRIKKEEERRYGISNRRRC